MEVPPGMDLGFILIEPLGGTAFVAAMFIGLGIGLLFDAVVAIKEKSVEIKLPVKASGVLWLLWGFYLLLVVG